MKINTLLIGGFVIIILFMVGFGFYITTQLKEISILNLDGNSGQQELLVEEIHNTVLFIIGGLFVISLITTAYISAAFRYFSRYWRLSCPTPCSALKLPPNSTTRS